MPKIIKIAMMCPMWRRLKLTDYVFNYYNQMKSTLLPSIELTLIAVGSEKETSREMAERNGFDYLEYPNVPLNKKFNAGVEYAKKYNPDVLVLLNSDNIITIDYFRAIESKPDSIIGLLDAYFLDLKNQKLGYWPGYSDGRKGEPIGPGRCFSREVLEKCHWQPWFQNMIINCVLDRNCRAKLNSLDIGCKGKYMNDIGCLAIDIKTDVNLWPWHSMKYKKIIKGDEMRTILKKAEIGDILDLNLLEIAGWL